MRGDAELVGELADEGVDAPGAHRIERGGGLVEEDVGGVERQRARDGDALAHAVAELGRVAVGELVHADDLEARAGLGDARPSG